MSDSDDNRFVAPVMHGNTEDRLEQSLRPANLSEIIGMKREKSNLKVMLESAQKRSSALDHILFHGPPGLGKTSLAMAVAAEMGVSLHITTGPAISKAGDLAAIITSLESRSILFIDEIHRLRHQVEEILYPAMEDRAIDIVIGKGPSAKTLRLDLPEFTIIAATTKLSMLSAPLRNRFGVDFRVDYYSDAELQEIVMQKAGKLGIDIEEEGALEIARRSRMTARIAVRILKRARDLSVVNNEKTITHDRVSETLKLLDIDELGLDMLDRKILTTLYHRFSSKPVGLNTLAASVSEDSSTIEEVYEPFLLQRGLLERTPKGRTVTASAVKYITENPQLFII